MGPGLDAAATRNVRYSGKALPAADMDTLPGGAAPSAGLGPLVLSPGMRMRACECLDPCGAHRAPVFYAPVAPP